MIYINESQVKSLLSMTDAIDVVELSTLDYSDGRASMPANVYLSIPGQAGDFRAMPSI